MKKIISKIYNFLFPYRREYKYIYGYGYLKGDLKLIDRTFEIYIDLLFIVLALAVLEIMIG